MVRRSEWSLSANHTGVLAVRRDCLVIESPNDVSPIIWPSPGTQWDPVLGVVTLDGIEARLGDVVALAGGESPLTGLVGGFVSAPSAGCLSYPVGWLASKLTVVQPGQ